MVSDMTTTKIDIESLEKLRVLAERSSRSTSSMLTLIINQAWRTHPAEPSENSALSGIMEQIVDDIEAGVTTRATSADAASAKATPINTSY